MARGRPVDLAISPFVFHLRETRDIRLSAEVTSVHWVGSTCFSARTTTGASNIATTIARSSCPACGWSELVIWGLTYRMFLGLRDRLAAVAGGDLHAAS